MADATSDKILVPLNYRIQRTHNLNTISYPDIIGPGGAYHAYCIDRDGKHIASIQFQNGPRNDINSIPGITESDLLEIVRHRLQCFQKGEYATRENACALTHIEEALMWMAKRTEDRAERNVLGTMQK